MPLYPLFADLHDRAVLVVGGGVVAARKIDGLLRVGAVVTVVAPALEPTLAALAAHARIRHVAARYADEWLDEVSPGGEKSNGGDEPSGYWLVIVATSDGALNRRIAAAGRRRRVFVNVVDVAALSSFHVPAGRPDLGIIGSVPPVTDSSSCGTSPLVELFTSRPAASRCRCS